MCWATSGRNNTWNDPQTNTIFLCCSCIVFALCQPRTVTSTLKTCKRAWRAKWCRLGTLNFSDNTLSSTCPFAHTKIYCLPISSECQICCSITLLLCMPTLSCGLATTPSSKCCKGVPSKNTSCNMPVFCPNVARHLQLLDKETFVERRFSYLEQNTKWLWLLCAKCEAKASPHHHNATWSTATLRARFTGGSRAPWKAVVSRQRWEWINSNLQTKSVRGYGQYAEC